jgi:hypothetical protein
LPAPKRKGYDADSVTAFLPKGAFVEGQIMVHERDFRSELEAYKAGEKEAPVRYPGRNINVFPDPVFTGAQSAFEVRDMDIEPEKPESGLGGFEVFLKSNGYWDFRWFPPASRGR